MEHTIEEYINSQRIIDLTVFGPIESIYNTVDLIKEYELVKVKQSKLSRKNRDRIENIYINAEKKFKEDWENKDTSRWDSMQKLIGLTAKLTKYVRNS